MKRSNKILLGIASVWPLIYIPLFIAFIFGFMVLGRGGGELPPEFGALFVLVLILHMFTIFLSLGLTIYYVIHAIKNEALKTDMKAVWVILFFFAGMIAEPAYWYMQIWKAPDFEAPRGELSEPYTPVWDTESVRSGAYQPPPEPPDWR